ncbi:hypothetical protein A3H22_01645 [Candidatus Peribacteria bacterium RIFCSPLOWO2_12_FULL_55_15]|nr:MAG: hypothetical protein A2789_02260 [Candidatus Peribacteria bacterium RIFCSPHIGHO2_01_FULL_54_22]OGJ62640.1 MAG: hypothetical protein A3D12_03690 [Candidatus Peribacteria bacterium RIFCSPHIGHO2_02_FULL_55_24]OGJ67958.1 MAG: hypothetical protein A2947_02480 [Candidatus Peribacteria bacterium RIFCSPLOWO2_01_FULL_54_110]OGJ70283.1 MAG: hypothetical protein A3H90_03475 [Candidatus Peribacteria bacterium RIFCSPLOWO2_02_FULL_55_36]OGJ72272.1 MAG: hypothetical protein A3H22_01645 [Candidatus Per
MLHVDISAALAKLLTPTYGITNQECTQLRTAVRRHVEEWLQERQNGEHAWSMDPYDRPLRERVKECAKRISSAHCQDILWIGIGGSALGPRVVVDSFHSPKTPRFHILDTADPAAIQNAVHAIDWTKVFVVIASKSGNTLESMSLFFYLWDELRKHRKGKAKEHVLAITDPAEGALRRFCIAQGIPMLPIPTDVGGRFSVFTPIGLLPMSLCGGNIDSFLRGAKEMDTLCQQTSLEENPAALLAVVQFLLDTKKRKHLRIVMPYGSRLRHMAAWDQQLIAESLGKGQSPIPLAANGPRDQHSLLQQWLAGPRGFWHLFIRELEKPRVTIPTTVESTFAFIAGKTFGDVLDACEEGTAHALTKKKHPNVTLSLSRLDEAHLGQLFFLFMVETVFLGKLYRIDPYGQPAVEQGKKITREILSN